VHINARLAFLFKWIKETGELGGVFKIGQIAQKACLGLDFFEE